MAGPSTPQSQDASPPPFEPTNTIDLVSINDSKIINVSLYSGRAEITRLYKLLVKTGLNQVTINGLPNVLDRESLRVEGRGAATIHDVALSKIPAPAVASTSETLEDLLSRKEWTEKALERAKRSIASLETYLSTLNIQHVDATELGKIIQNYDATGQKIDEKIMELEKSLKTLDKDIATEREKLVGPTVNKKLRQRAVISVFAEFMGEVEIALIYAVHQATWNAGYDIRVDIQTKDKPVTLIYKAGITQNTGEAWDDVPLTLETAAPTFGVNIPVLVPWNISVYKPVMKKSKRSFSRGGTDSSLSTPLIIPPQASQLLLFGNPMTKKEGENEDVLRSFTSDNGVGMEHPSLAVSSMGGVSATFRVPGAISIPSDGAAHNVTVVQLKLDAIISWVTVPKVDSKTHMKAKIKNASDYTLLRGTASVYVDGSFISRSDVPLVSPQESFNCPLGLDPSIRITYHPPVKKVSHSGFYTKASNYIFFQRITVFNTKTSAIDNLKVIDQMPVSESAQVTVKLVTPNLVIPEPPSSAINSHSRAVHAPPPVKVSDGVVAQWEGADEEGFDIEHLGRDGKFNWICSVPAQGKANLLLSWEVSAPLRTEIVGL